MYACVVVRHACVLRGAGSMQDGLVRGTEGGSTAHAMAAASQQMAGGSQPADGRRAGELQPWESCSPASRCWATRGRVRAAANPWTDTSAGEAVSNDARVAGSPRLKVGHLGRGRIGPHVRASAKPSERKRARFQRLGPASPGYAETRRPKAMPMPAEVSSMREAGSHMIRQRRAQAGLRAGSGGRIPLPHSAVL